MNGLRIFEKHPDSDAYRFGPSFTPYVIVAVEKRFTDAELAAEHWSSCALWFNTVRRDDDYEGAPDTREHQRQALIFERFAHLPHFDEVTP